LGDRLTEVIDSVVIRPASVADAESLACFAEQIFRATFGPGNRTEDMDRYVAESFGPAYQRADISDPSGVVFIAEIQGAIVGYVQVCRHRVHDEIDAISPIELKRFYVARDFHGRGLAQRLMDTTLAYAAECSADVMWLAVFENNPRAISFYRKSGFVDTATQSFLLGSDEQTDIVMRRNVSMRVGEASVAGGRALKDCG
jgi:ribosomal protein S18 acetylase RimI-like enzyme